MIELRTWVKSTPESLRQNNPGGLADFEIRSEFHNRWLRVEAWTGKQADGVLMRRGENDVTFNRSRILYY